MTEIKIHDGKGRVAFTCEFENMVQDEELKQYIEELKVLMGELNIHTLTITYMGSSIIIKQNA